MSRELSDLVVRSLTGEDPTAVVTRRDLVEGVPLLEPVAVSGLFVAPEERSVEQRQSLLESDRLTTELEQCDVLVLGFPIYNFSVPASVKAWFDQVARAGRTFQYTPSGPKGLLIGRRAVLAVASGGTRIESDIDFAVRYARHFLNFLGVSEVDVIAADGTMQDDTAMDRARERARQYSVSASS